MEMENPKSNVESTPEQDRAIEAHQSSEMQQLYGSDQTAHWGRDYGADADDDGYFVIIKPLTEEMQGAYEACKKLKMYEKRVAIVSTAAKIDEENANEIVPAPGVFYKRYIRTEKGLSVSEKGCVDVTKAMRSLTSFGDLTMLPPSTGPTIIVHPDVIIGPVVESRSPPSTPPGVKALPVVPVVPGAPKKRARTPDAEEEAATKQCKIPYPVLVDETKAVVDETAEETAEKMEVETSLVVPPSHGNLDGLTVPVKHILAPEKERAEKINGLMNHVSMHVAPTVRFAPMDRFEVCFARRESGNSKGHVDFYYYFQIQGDPMKATIRARSYAELVRMLIAME